MHPPAVRLLPQLQSRPVALFSTSLTSSSLPRSRLISSTSTCLGRQLRLRMRAISTRVPSQSKYSLLVVNETYISSLQSQFLHCPRRSFWWSKKPEPGILLTGNGAAAAATAGEGSSAGPSRYPTRYLFYYAGRRTIYLACLKLCTLFVAAFGIVIVAPGWYYNIQYEVVEPESEPEPTTIPLADALTPSTDSNPSPPVLTLRKRDTYTFHLPLLSTPITLPAPLLATLVPLTITVLSSLPFILMHSLSPPYITHAHLHLPANPSARLAFSPPKGNLLLSPTTSVTFTTLRALGRPKATTMPLGDLRWEVAKLGCANLVYREPGAGARAGKGSTRKERVTRFYMDERGSPARVAGDPEGRVARGVLEWVKEWTERELKKGRK